MYYFQGLAALTKFRLQQLQQNLQKALPAITHISAHYDFFVDAKTLTENQQTQLAALLSDSVPAMLSRSWSNGCLWVVPRLGTISPWSSKATDIARICEFDSVQRIERGIRYQLKIKQKSVSENEWQQILRILYDPLTESVIETVDKLNELFDHHQPKPDRMIPMLIQGKSVLIEANQSLGLSLNEGELDYLYQAYDQLQRDPSETELMMFSQVNSEHCRHKIFNAKWRIDDKEQVETLFSMIRNTHKKNPYQVLVAYKDNAAVLKGSNGKRFYPDAYSKKYRYRDEDIPIVLKVETHNHPTAISPFAGAATGSGGEIRDEAATGRGAKPKAGLTGFSVSHLQIPGWPQPWEIELGKPKHMASALEIMLSGPIGAASFNNEFGRPNLCGYFRTFEMKVNNAYGQTYRGYHKPIMIAGGIGNINLQHVEKKDLPVGALLIVLGGPAMAIGLGGGSASSRASNEDSEALDFASVQRSNPEMQRRCQEVIDVCWSLGEKNPILSIHDVGAGGLSNAMPELVAACHLGAHIKLRRIPNAAIGMSPMEIWCNEAQERFVLSIMPDDLILFSNIALRERCLFAVVGEVTADNNLIVADQHFNNNPVDMPMNVLFDDMPEMHCQDDSSQNLTEKLNTEEIILAEAIKRVLQFPCVADKTFLITIGDRSVTGLVVRDQMVGPWQVPVADVAVTCSGFQAYTGEAMAMGERTPVALVHPAASARMAVGEAITNIAAAAIDDISQIALSANWMAAPQSMGEGAGLYEAVQTIGMELCPALGISIPVGKDSLSMRTEWSADGEDYSVTSPISLVITAAAPVSDVRRTLTPELQLDCGETQLLLIDLGEGCHGMAGSVLAQVYQVLEHQPPDVDDPVLLKHFFQAIQALNKAGLLLAYHDRSDGGLLATLTEMMFASHVGLTCQLGGMGNDPITLLFNEELGAVIQVRVKDLAFVEAILVEFKLIDCVHKVAVINNDDQLNILFHEQGLYSETRTTLHRFWSETSYRMQAMRDNSICAEQAFDRLLDAKEPGLFSRLTFDVTERITSPYINITKPKVAILREQGINGHIEMAAAFDRAKFESVDVHMSDILSGKVHLRDFVGLVACGGFSYGDVLGAGRGWAQSILMHPHARQQFQDFFARQNTFTLGICNGCQMLTYLKDIIPGAEYWPRLERNQSEQFEARVALVQIQQSPSILLRHMEGSILPITVAHGEGRIKFSSKYQSWRAEKQHLITLRYVNHYGEVTESYPQNPNGSPEGITGLTTKDGRITILMPHPERVFRTVQNSWHDKGWGEDGPWLRLFENARFFCG